MKNFKEKFAQTKKAHPYFVIVMLMLMLVVGNAMSYQFPVSRAEDKTTDLMSIEEIDRIMDSLLTPNAKLPDKTPGSGIEYPFERTIQKWKIALGKANAACADARNRQNEETVAHRDTAATYENTKSVCYFSYTLGLDYQQYIKTKWENGTDDQKDRLKVELEAMKNETIKFADEEAVCDIYMKDFAVKLMEDYKKFLETNFQNKSSTSSLLPGAIAKYRELKAQLNIAYSRYHPTVGSHQLIAGVQPGACQAIIDSTLADAKYALKTHAISTGGVKKSAALLEKYQQINAELSGLYQQFVYFKGYLDSFSSKLSCYPKLGCIHG